MRTDAPDTRNQRKPVRTDIPDALDTYGNQLYAAIERDLARGTRTGRLKRRALALSVPATAAVATTATVLLTAGGASGPSLASAAIVRHVRAELAAAPPGSIRHESAIVTLSGGSSMSFELWAQTNGTGDATGVYRVIKDGQEVSQSATENKIYDPSTNTITVSPLPPAIHQGEISRGGDPAGELKQMVDSGQATATPTTYKGTPAFELSVNSSSDPSLNGTAYVARSDYRPLEIDSTSAKVVFSTYEYLPASPSNDALLAVTTAHPSATVVNQP